MLCIRQSLAVFITAGVGEVVCVLLLEVLVWNESKATFGSTFSSVSRLRLHVRFYTDILCIALSLKIFGLGLKFLRKIVEHYAVEHLIQLYHILDISAYKLISKGN